MVSAGGFCTVLYRNEETKADNVTFLNWRRGVLHPTAFRRWDHTVLLRSDGRAVTCRSNRYGQCDIPPLDYVQVLMERYHAWCTWSFSVGLLENQQKTVEVASTPARRATLRKFWPEYVATNAELLGSCSMVACRGLMPRELEHVTACKRVLWLLACIGLPFECYMRACRSFAISKVACGWIARAPPLTLCKSLSSCVHMGSRRLRRASAWLRAAFFGGGLHLDVLFATQLVGVLSRTQCTRALLCVWDSYPCVK